MKRVLNWIKRELTLKIDFINNDIEIGYIWLVWLFIMFLSNLSHFIVWLIK